MGTLQLIQFRSADRRLRRCAALVAVIVLAGWLLTACGEGATETEEPAEVATEPASDAAPEPAAESEPQSELEPKTEPEPQKAAKAEEAAATPEPEATPVVPVTVTDETGAEITITSVDRIIPLDGTVAEVVFALDLGDNVVATDLSATYPPEADALPEIGYQRALSAEPIATFEPTVLLATDIAGPPGTLDELRALGYPLVIVPNEATADGPGDKIRAVANALGVPERGRALAAKVDHSIADSTATVDSTSAGEAPGPRVVALYVRGTSAQLALGRENATHWLIEAAGGVDVADELGIDDSAPISAEAMLVADPEVLLVPATGLDSVGGVDGLLEIDGLARTSAGEAGLVLAYDDQLLLGNGPRVGDLLADLRRELAAVARP